MNDENGMMKLSLRAIARSEAKQSLYRKSEGIASPRVFAMARNDVTR